MGEARGACGGACRCVEMCRLTVRWFAISTLPADLTKTHGGGVFVREAYGGMPCFVNAHETIPTLLPLAICKAIQARRGGTHAGDVNRSIRGRFYMPASGGFIRLACDVVLYPQAIRPNARTRHPAARGRGGAERACRRFDDDGGYAGNRHTDLNKTEEQMLENFRDTREEAHA